MKRIFFAIVIFLLAVPTFAHADDASKRAKIQQLLTALHLDRNLQAAVEGLRQQVNDMSRRQFPGTDLTDVQQKKLTDFQQQASQIINAELNWARFEPEYIKIYGDAYSEDEIDGILAFYKTPAGLAMLAKSPEINTKSAQFSQERLRAIQPQMAKLMGDFQKDIAPPAPATPK